MKTTTILLALSALAHRALANPISGLRLTSTRDVAPSSEGAMTFTGPAVVGGPDVTLTGTAESIHSQLLALNPSYDAMAFPDFAERQLNATLSARGKPDGLGCFPGGSPVADWNYQCKEGYNFLKGLNGKCRAEARSCARVSCSHGCGISLCNDNDHWIDVACVNLAGDAADINTWCGKDTGNGWASVPRRPVKGQVFRDFDDVKWNTIVKEDFNNCPL